MKMKVLLHFGERRETPTRSPDSEISSDQGVTTSVSFSNASRVNVELNSRAATNCVRRKERRLADRNLIFSSVTNSGLAIRGGSDQFDLSNAFWRCQNAPPSVEELKGETSMPDISIPDVQNSVSKHSRSLSDFVTSCDVSRDFGGGSTFQVPLTELRGKTTVRMPNVSTSNVQKCAPSASELSRSLGNSDRISVTSVDRSVGEDSIRHLFCPSKRDYCWTPLFRRCDICDHAPVTDSPFYYRRSCTGSHGSSRIGHGFDECKPNCSRNMNNPNRDLGVAKAGFRAVNCYCCVSQSVVRCDCDHIPTQVVNQPTKEAEGVEYRNGTNSCCLDSECGSNRRGTGGLSHCPETCCRTGGEPVSQLLRCALGSPSLDRQGRELYRNDVIEPRCLLRLTEKNVRDCARGDDGFVKCNPPGNIETPNGLRGQRTSPQGSGEGIPSPVPVMCCSESPSGLEDTSSSAGAKRSRVFSKARRSSPPASEKLEPRDMDPANGFHSTTNWDYGVSQRLPF